MTLFVTSCSTYSDLVDPLKVREAMDDAPAAQDPIPDPSATISLDDGSDWILLKSGEWLRGEILRMRDGKIDFDSDEFDDQTVDFADVRRIVSPHHQVVQTEDGRMFEGTVAADEKNVWITDGKTVQLARDEVFSFLAVDGEQASSWFGRLSVGTTVRSGNTEQADFSSLAEAVRETTRTRWASRYIGATASTNNEETANNHRIGSRYDVFLTRRAFVTVPGIDVFRDRFQNIDLRVTPSAAIGYKVVDSADHTWSVSLGPAYQYERLASEQPGEDAERNSAAVVFSSGYDWDITGDIEFKFDYNITAPVPDTVEYNHNFVMQLEVEIFGDFTLDVGFVWDRVNRPQVDADGNLPEQDDYRTTIGLGWTF